MIEAAISEVHSSKRPEPAQRPVLRAIRGGAADANRLASSSDREMIESTVAALEVFTAKWKVELLYLRAAGVRRLKHLHEHLLVSKKVLGDALKALERDGLVRRSVYAETLCGSSTRSRRSGVRSPSRSSRCANGRARTLRRCSPPAGRLTCVRGGVLDDAVLDLGLHKRLHTWRALSTLQVEPGAKTPIYRDFAEPSDGLEPSTPSLPCAFSATGRNARQWFWLVSAVSGRAAFAIDCPRLQPRGSIKAPSRVVSGGNNPRR
jgi:hypothetical protein